MFEKGTVVKYADEWCRGEEKKLFFVVLENYDNINRCKIGCINSSLTWGFVEVVDYKMIVKA